uniref:Lytic murein transglycosylase n=1 Tax=Steinernema glaseri TaxID=37863 RepID=A0A1I7ZMX4_9BILA
MIKWVTGVLLWLFNRAKAKGRTNFWDQKDQAGKLGLEPHLSALTAQNPNLITELDLWRYIPGLATPN